MTTLRLWINAYIPQTVAGYTMVIPKGAHAGKTAVPLPGLARTNPLNLFKNWDAGYLTDQRTWSNALGASVRMQSFAELRLTPQVSVVKTDHRSSGTTEVDMATGNQLGFDVAKMNRCQFSTLSARLPVHRSKTYHTFPLGVPYTLDTPANGPPIHELRLVGQASDPLVSAAADIDYEGVFQISMTASPWRCQVVFEGLIDAFPAFECYAQLNGQTKCLFTAPPPAGNTVTNLPGSANRRISGRVLFG